MSKQAVTQLLERALSDQAFVAQLKSDFDTAIKGYDLTADEIAALKSGGDDDAKAWGLDERLSKSYMCWR